MSSLKRLLVFSALLKGELMLEGVDFTLRDEVPTAMSLPGTMQDSKERISTGNERLDRECTKSVMELRRTLEVVVLE